MKTAYINPFPIRTINFSNIIDKTHYAKIIKLVELMYNLHNQLTKIKSPNEKQVIQRQIDAIGQQIDSLVFELYGLTKKEIKIVEECFK